MSGALRTGSIAVEDADEQVIKGGLLTLCMQT